MQPKSIDERKIHEGEYAFMNLLYTGVFRQTFSKWKRDCRCCKQHIKLRNDGCDRGQNEEKDNSNRSWLCGIIQCHSAGAA